MRLGVSSFAFGWAIGMPGHPVLRPFDELDVVAFARRHQLSVIQLGDHVPLPTFDEARLDRLHAAARTPGATPIELEIGARGLTEQHLFRYIELAQRLDARLLRFVIDAAGWEPEADTVISILNNAVGELRAAHVVLGIENHDRFPARTLRRIVEDVGSEHVGICLDTVNSLGAGEGLNEVLDQLAPLTVNLHLKDYAITRVPYAMGFTVEGRPAGSGRLPVAQVRDLVARWGRCQTAVLETWVPPENSVAETIAKEHAWAEQSMMYLKPFFPR